MSVLTLEEKIAQMLGSSDIQEANVDGSKLPGERDDLDSEEVGKRAAAKEKKTKFPGNDKGVEMKQEKQGVGNSDLEGKEEDLGAEEDGKAASAKAKYAGGLKAKGGAEGAAPNFNTVADPGKVVGAGSSKGNVDGTRLESIDLTPIFGDTELSEEFKDKATSMFEAVVQARVNHEFEALQEQYEAELSEEVAEIKAQLIEKVDVFLDKVVEAYIEENKLSIETGLRAEIAEGFIDGLKNLFKESYIEVPEEKFDILADLEEQVDELKSRVTEQEQLIENLVEDNDKLLKESVFAQVTEGLAETEVEKLRGLVKGVAFESADLFEEKVRVIRENYFPKTAKTSAEQQLIESADGNDLDNSVVSQYAQALAKTFRK